MALDLKPLAWDWPAVTAGDTFPSIRIQESSSDSTCARVRVKIKSVSTATASLTLDSDESSITIDSGASGGWDFTIESISGTDTASLTTGYYCYDIEVTDGDGNVRTEFSGTWQILPQITD